MKQHFHSYLQYEYSGILNDAELEYHESLCHKLLKNKMLNDMDRGKIVLEHHAKVMYTLSVLMSLLKLDFHFNRIEANYKEDYSLETLVLLVTRCRKMYQSI